MKDPNFSFRTNWKYELKEEYCYKLPVTLPGTGGKLVDPKGHLLIEMIPCHNKNHNHTTIRFGVGYRWDGPSGPTIDTSNGMRASLVHDGLYQALREKWLCPKARKAADIEFLRILKADGMTWWRRWGWYLGVRIFASWAARPPSAKPSSKLKKIMIAIVPPVGATVLVGPSLIDWLLGIHLRIRSAIFWIIESICRRSQEGIVESEVCDVPSKEAVAKLVDSATAYASLSESFATYAMSIIGGSIAIIVGTSYLRPAQMRVRLIYLLFLPGWLGLACSIYYGTVIARRHVAIQTVLPEHTRTIFQRMNMDLVSQLEWFRYGILMFGVWLVGVLVWWVLGTPSPKCGTGQEEA